MKITRLNNSIKYLALVICILSNGGIVAQESEQFIHPVSQAEEIKARMNLYKRIKIEQNKKVLMQLLHDIADIQKQCRDKGYLCSMESGNTLNPLLVDLNQSTPQLDDMPTASPKKRVITPDLNLLGIVGGRVRFRLEDGRIEDFSLGELVADLWEVAEINPETALLIYRKQPKIKVRYQIHREIISKHPHQENTTESIR